MRKHSNSGPTTCRRTFPRKRTRPRNKNSSPKARSYASRSAAIEKQVKDVEAELHAALLAIPNLTHPDAPVGHTVDDNKVITTWGEKPKFDFKPKDHVALVEALDLADFEAGARVAGQKFYFLKREAALLELALVQYAMQTLVREGFMPIITPDLARGKSWRALDLFPAIRTPRRGRFTPSPIAIYA